MSLSIFPFHAQQFEQLIIHDLYLSVYPPVYNSLTGGGGSLAPDRLFWSVPGPFTSFLQVWKVEAARCDLMQTPACICSSRTRVDELAQPTKLDAISHFDAGILHQCHIDSLLNHKPTCLPLYPLCARLFSPSFVFPGSTLSFFHVMLPFITIKCNAAQQRATWSGPGDSLWWCTLSLSLTLFRHLLRWRSLCLPLSSL